MIHEFIHKIDMRDGAPDGCPPLPSRAARQAWLAVMQAEYEAFREKVIIAERFGGEPPWLDAYGATVDRRILRSGLRSLLRQPRSASTIEFPALVAAAGQLFLRPSVAAGS